MPEDTENPNLPPTLRPAGWKVKTTPDLVLVRNISKGSICEHPGGKRIVIEAGQVGPIEEERVKQHPGDVEIVTEKDLTPADKKQLKALVAPFDDGSDD